MRGIAKTDHIKFVQGFRRKNAHLFALLGGESARLSAYQFQRLDAAGNGRVPKTFGARKDQKLSIFLRLDRRRSGNGGPDLSDLL